MMRMARGTEFFSVALTKDLENSRNDLDDTSK